MERFKISGFRIHTLLFGTMPSTWIPNLIYSVTQKPSLEANSFSGNQNILRLVCNPKAHY